MATQRKPTPEAPRVSRDNYFSHDFFQGEKEHLWPKVWQVAGRLEEIPKVGDYITYDIADDSITVIRTSLEQIKAYHNACPHRGRALTEGCGRISQFRCKYHGWTFNLDGKNVLGQDRHDWDETPLQDEEIGLFPVHVDLWGGFIWINMSDNPETLAEYLETVPQFLDPFEFQNMRFRWYLEIKLPCNWKVALEAFMEGYHV